MDFLFWYGMFWYAIGTLVAASFTYLWMRMPEPPPRHIETIEVDHDARARHLLAQCDDLAL